MANRTTWATIQTQSPPDYRGGGTATPRKFNLQSGQVSWSHGSEPATAELTYIGSVPVSVGSWIRIQVAGSVFDGVCESDNPLEGSGGKHRILQFKDNRYYLDWDVCWGHFNMPDETIEGGVRLKRYKHILPIDYETMTVTYTNTAYSAKQIIKMLLSAPSTEDTWVCIYHKAQNEPVFEMTFDGESLRSALAKISEAQGLVFTLMGGPFRLVWSRKGEGVLPTFQHFRLNNTKTAYNANAYQSLAPVFSDNRQDGFSLSGNPTRLIVAGDRNAYQVHDIPVQPDWLQIWERFFYPTKFIEEIYLVGKLTQPLTLESESGQSHTFPAGTTFKAVGDLNDTLGKPFDTGRLVGGHMATAAALDMTMRQYAALKANPAFLDTRKFSGRSRADMPAVLYINQILFRAFRFAPGFKIKNRTGKLIPLNSLGIASKMLARVSHDPTSGAMSWDRDENADGNGYAIAKGYQVGKDLFATLRPERFDFKSWTDSRNIWQHLEFQIDDSGEADGQFILFDEPVIDSSELVEIVDGNGVLKANPNFVAPQVRIACTFLAERFLYYKGRGTRDEVESVPGLNAEYTSSFTSADLPVEQPFSDGQTASAKADVIAASLLNNQFIHQRGHYTRWIPKTANGIYPSGTQLNGKIDRVTITFGPTGCSEDVELTMESPRRYYIPERDLDRGAQMKQLLPGQSELRHQSNLQRLNAAALRQSPETAKTTNDAFNSVFGATGRSERIPVAGNGTSTVTLKVGTPFQKEPTVVIGTRATKTQFALPAGATDTHVEFGGVSLHQDNLVPPHGASIAAQKEGDILARVKGPCKVGEVVQLVSGQDYLSVASSKGAVGKAMQDIAGEGVKLIRVRTSSSSAVSDTGFPFQVVKLTDTTAKVVINSHLFTGLDVKTLQKIYGLNTEFEFGTAQNMVWLEMLFDKNGVLFLANICRGNLWDSTVYPKTVRSLKKADDPNLDVMQESWIAPASEKTANRALVDAQWAAFDTNTRHFKSFMLIGYLTRAKSAKGLAFRVFDTASTFLQSLKSNLLLTNFCEQSLPVKYPILWTLPVLDQLPTPDIVNETGTIFIGIPFRFEPLYYYTTDGSTPSDRSTLYGGYFSQPPLATVVKAIAYEDGYFESDVASLNL